MNFNQRLSIYLLSLKRRWLATNTANKNSCKQPPWPVSRDNQSYCSRMGIKTTRSGVKSVNDKEKSKRKIFLKISLFLHRGKSNLLGCQSSTKSSKRRQRRSKKVIKTSAIEFYLYFYSKEAQLWQQVLALS